MIGACEKCKTEKAFLVIKERLPFSPYPDLKLCYECALVEIRTRIAARPTVSASGDADAKR